MSTLLPIDYAMTKPAKTLTLTAKPRTDAASSPALVRTVTHALDPEQTPTTVKVLTKRSRLVSTAVQAAPDAGAVYVAPETDAAPDAELPAASGAA